MCCQELGGSNSAYSLSNQLRLNPAFQNSDGSPAVIEDLARLIKKMRDEWKVRICDVCPASVARPPRLGVCGGGGVGGMD